MRPNVDPHTGRGSIIRLQGLMGGEFVREVVAHDQGSQMFPRFLLQKTIRVVCRQPQLTPPFAAYEFLHLAHVEGLTRSQTLELWPWREDAFRVLTNPRLHLSDFEERLCCSLLAWGRPPTEEQRRRFGRIAERQSSAWNRMNREALLRVARHRRRRVMQDPTPINVLLQEALNELRDIWLQSS